MTKKNKILLLMMVSALSLMPLIISYGLVFFGVMLMYGIDIASYMMFHPMILGGMAIYIAWRVHVNYNRLKKIIIEDTDRIKEVLEKIRDEKFKERFGR